MQTISINTVYNHQCGSVIIQTYNFTGHFIPVYIHCVYMYAKLELVQQRVIMFNIHVKCTAWSICKCNELTMPHKKLASHTV